MEIAFQYQVGKTFLFKETVLTVTVEGCRRAFDLIHTEVLLSFGSPFRSASYSQPQEQDKVCQAIFGHVRTRREKDDLFMGKIYMFERCARCMLVVHTFIVCIGLI